MKVDRWKARPEGTIRAAIGIVVWLLSTVFAAISAGSCAHDGASQLCWFVAGFLVLCLLSVFIFRGSKEQETGWVVSACIEAMRWQLLAASVLGAIGLTVAIERHGEPVLQALGENFGLAWLLLMLTAAGAGVGTMLTRSYAIGIHAREQREAREAMAHAVAEAIRDSSGEWRDVFAQAVGREVAESIGGERRRRTTVWDRVFGR